MAFIAKVTYFENGQKGKQLKMGKAVNIEELVV